MLTAGQHEGHMREDFICCHGKQKWISGQIRIDPNHRSCSWNEAEDPHIATICLFNWSEHGSKQRTWEQMMHWGNLNTVCRFIATIQIASAGWAKNPSQAWSLTWLGTSSNLWHTAVIDLASDIFRQEWQTYAWAGHWTLVLTPWVQLCCLLHSAGCVRASETLLWVQMQSPVKSWASCVQTRSIAS